MVRWQSRAAPRRIIFLNGTSSSGKSSIAEALLTVLGEPWFSLLHSTG
jgi:chloramphenicol 3-O phosphotransferase